MMGVISAADETMIELFSGMSTRQFAKLICQLRAEGAKPPLKGRPWKLGFEDRVLLVAAYWRTNLTMRQIAALFGTSKSAADRINDDLAPKLALRPRQRYAPGTVLIVDGTLVPTRDHTVAAKSKNYRAGVDTVAQARISRWRHLAAEDGGLRRHPMTVFIHRRQPDQVPSWLRDAHRGPVAARPGPASSTSITLRTLPGAGFVFAIGRPDRPPISMAMSPMPTAVPPSTAPGTRD